MWNSKACAHINESKTCGLPAFPRANPRQIENEVDITLYNTDTIGPWWITHVIGKLWFIYDPPVDSSPFIGYIDDLFITERALTPQQVIQYHQTGHKTITLDILLYNQSCSLTHKN